MDDLIQSLATKWKEMLSPALMTKVLKKKMVVFPGHNPEQVTEALPSAWL